MLRRVCVLALSTLVAACSLLVGTDGLTGAPSAAPDAVTDVEGEDAGDLDGSSADGEPAPYVRRCPQGELVGWGARTPVEASDAAVLVHPGAEMSPTLMRDGDVFKLWWVSSTGDGLGVFHAQASSLEGPWRASDSDAPNSSQIVLRGSRQAGSWDQYNIESVSVIRVGATFYAYYGTGSAVGVAAGNGSVFERQNGGEPILRQANPTDGGPTPLRHPRAFFFDGKFYLSVADVSAGVPEAGAYGQFIFRASDPTFQADLESLTVDGWVSGDHRTLSLAASHGGDLAYSRELERVFLSAPGPTYMVFTLFDLARPEKLPQVLEVSHRTTSLAFLRTPEGYIEPGEDCSTLSIEMISGIWNPVADLFDFGTTRFDVKMR